MKGTVCKLTISRLREHITSIKPAQTLWVVEDDELDAEDELDVQKQIMMEKIRINVSRCKQKNISIPESSVVPAAVNTNVDMEPMDL